MKIGYERPDGHTSTAYLNDYDTNTDGIYHGVDKYTEEPVVVIWTGDKWAAITPVQADSHPQEKPSA